MKKILILIFLFNILLLPVYSENRVVRTMQNQPNYSSLYGDDLSVVEEYLFGGNYRADTVQSRMNRIERRLFSRCYPTLTLSQRMNNILANYNKTYSNRNYISEYEGSPVQRFKNIFFGQPTGFTPPVMNLPFNDYGRPYGLNKSIYNNRGSYSYSNENPASYGMGVHILKD